MTAGRTSDIDDRVATWLDDLFWHRKMYRGARWRWWGEHVMKMLTTHTGGQLIFETVEDLRKIEECRQDAATEALTCQLAMADPLEQAGDRMGRWTAVAEAVELSETDCSATVWIATTHPEWPRTNHNVQRVLRVVRRQPFNNPLIEVLELKQMWRLHQAVEEMLEDTTCDVIEHLRKTRPDSVLCEAANTLTSTGLDTRLAANLEQRGRYGDPRRIPRQVL